MRIDALLLVLVPAQAPASSVQFEPAVIVPTGAGYLPAGITVADLDGDGRSEILTADTFAETVTVLRNEGGGNYVPTALSAGTGEFRDVAVGDVTGDGVPDIVASERSGSATLVVFDGLGDATFAAGRSFGPPSASSDVELADLDGDGDLDAAVAIRGGQIADPMASVFLNDGNGSFSPPTDYTFVANVPFAYGSTLAIGDLDGDGVPDLAGTGQPNVNAVGLLRGLGDGTFGPATVVDLGVRVPMALVLCDLDADGHDDLAVYEGDFADPRVVLAENDGSGQLGNVRSVSVAAPVSFEETRRALAFADFSGDGSLDFVASNTVAVNTAQGFAAALPVALGFEAAVADFDLDGRLDVLVATRDASFNGQVAIYRNTTGDVSGYCTAGWSASGCRASLSTFGIPSVVAPSGFEIRASSVEGASAGLFFFGTNGRQANPWGNGTSYQCVIPPVTRGGLLTGTGMAGQCNGTFSQDLNARWTAKPNQNPGAGATVQAQLWYRDPLNTSNQTTSFSDAIEFVVAP